MNNDVYIEATPDTPEVELSQSKGVIRFKGRCHPLDPYKYFKDIMDWIETYANDPPKVTLVFIDLEFIQGGSIKLILEFLRTLNQIIQHNCYVYVHWIENESSENLDYNEDLSSSLEIPSFFLSYTDLLSSMEILDIIKEDLNIRNIDEQVIETFKYGYGYLSTKNGRISSLDIYGLATDNLPEILYGLEELNRLAIHSSQIQNIPHGISGLRNLNQFHLVSNKNLDSLPAEILDLNLGFTKYKDSDGIFIYDDKLESPPIEIIHRGFIAVSAYFSSIKDKKVLLNELKLILVGEGASGKTSLVKRLLGDEFDINEPQTHGILMKQWNISINDHEICVNIWDFGGQEIMHSTHQFFLTKRSIYLLVLDCRKDEKTEDWLKLIRSFGEDSPILLVINKTDENPGFDLDHNYLKAKYPNIKEFHKISCLTNYGISDLTSSIKKEVSKNEFLRIKWSEKWLSVKKELEKTNYQFINENSFHELCNRNGIDSLNEIHTIIDLLNDLGVIVHFNDFQLRDTFVIDPIWITTAVYKIINSKILSDNDGVLKLASLNEIFRTKETDIYYYPSSIFVYIINLMKRFELCYSINNKEVLIPDLLPIKGVNPNQYYDFRLFLQYDFLPRSVLPRFIVKMHEDIPKDGKVWRTGVEIKDDDTNTNALVYADYHEKRIYIKFRWYNISDYLTVLLFIFRNINNSHKDLKYSIRVPMPDDNRITVSYEHLLYLFNEKGHKTYIPDGSKKEYNIENLLGKFHKERSTKEDIESIINKISKISNKESDFETINEIVMVKPNFMGIGLDLNKFISLFMKRSR